MKPLISPESKISYNYLIQWMIIAIVAGLMGAIVINGFSFIIGHIQSFLLSFERVPLFLWPVVGAVLVGFFIYPIAPGARGEGIPSYLIAIRKHGGRLSGWETICKFAAATVTLGTFGNGGLLGPVGRVSAGVMSLIQQKNPHKMDSDHKIIYPICGLAAVFGALFHSSIGAGVFAVEIIQKSDMSYRRLFPAILASTASVFFAQILGFEPLIVMSTLHKSVAPSIMGIILLLALVSGITGRAFIMLYALVAKAFHREKGLTTCGVTIRAILGSAIAGSLVYVFNPHLMGTSTKILTYLFEGDKSFLYGILPPGTSLSLVIVLIILVKALANTVTVGSGMSAGFAGPAVFIGLLLGALFAEIFHIPWGSPEYYALLVAGFAGMFSSTMNTPIASAILGVELFGLYYSLPSGLAAIIGFQINRSRTLYDMVLKEETNHEADL
ncbi:MAG: chloride channel protein [Spirochaetales bacterium]|nr:chloride channel protein [Spirochaetales bacterium]